MRVEPRARRSRLVARARAVVDGAEQIAERDPGREARQRRLLVAVAGPATGDVTRAAHLAGFAGLAQFSRTSRTTLGDSPAARRRGLLQL